MKVFYSTAWNLLRHKLLDEHRIILAYLQTQEKTILAMCIVVFLEDPRSRSHFIHPEHGASQRMTSEYRLGVH